MENRRNTNRKTTNNFFGVYHKESQEYFGRLLNMSTDGIMILAVNTMQANTHYDFKIEFPHSVAGKKYLFFSAECVWCRESKDSSDVFDAGFRITEIDFEATKIIQYLLNDPLFTDDKDQPRITLVERTV